MEMIRYVEKRGRIHIYCMGTPYSIGYIKKHKKGYSYYYSVMLINKLSISRKSKENYSTLEECKKSIVYGR
jgi:hypothetical protein